MRGAIISEDQLKLLPLEEMYSKVSIDPVIVDHSQYATVCLGRWCMEPIE